MYKDIAPEPNSLVVNLGTTLAKISGGRIKATMHRVLDIGIERYACPFFLEPKFSAILADDVLQSERPFCEDREHENMLREKGVKLTSYGEFILSKNNGNWGEWKGFKLPEDRI